MSMFHILAMFQHLLGGDWLLDQLYRREDEKELPVFADFIRPMDTLQTPTPLPSPATAPGSR
jgi:hypothetical protein